MQAIDTERHTLLDLEPAIMSGVVNCIMHTAGLDNTRASWQTVLNFSTTTRQLLDLMTEVLFEMLHIGAEVNSCFAKRSLGWPHALRSLMVGGCLDCSTWRKLRPLCAVRPGTAVVTPLRDVPRLSGASLVAVNGTHLVVYGGRSSSTGETSDVAYLVQVGALPAGLAKWDRLVCDRASLPPPRCYHGAAILQHGRDRTVRMFIFGGAGHGDLLHDDTWSLELSLDSGSSYETKSCKMACWRQLQTPLKEQVPTARSSYVLATWQSVGCALLHGGLGGNGVRSDVWALSPEGLWNELPTTGACVARAHHCGAVHRDCLLVHSGQDETFLTVHSVHCLDLNGGIWQEIIYPTGPNSRIDAVAASMEGVGVLIFGGVDSMFEFEPMDVWLLRNAGESVGHAQVESSC